MLDITPTRPTRFVMPLRAVPQHQLGLSDEDDETLDAAPYAQSDEDETEWAVLDDAETPLIDPAVIQAANYYRGSFIDLIA